MKHFKEAESLQIPIPTNLESELPDYEQISATIAYRPDASRPDNSGHSYWFANLFLTPKDKERSVPMFGSIDGVVKGGEAEVAEAVKLNLETYTLYALIADYIVKQEAAESPVARQ